MRAALAAETASRPRDPVLRFASGVAAEAENDLAAAEKDYRAALAAAPRFGAAANNLAWLLATRLGRAAEARPFAETAARVLPRSAQALDTRGWVRFLCGDAAGAEPDLARAVRGMPGRADVAERHAAAVRAAVREPGRARDPALPNDPQPEVPR
jgi:Tfp pilus assembly protein PilF